MAWRRIPLPRALPALALVGTGLALAWAHGPWASSEEAPAMELTLSGFGGGGGETGSSSYGVRAALTEVAADELAGDGVSVVPGPSAALSSAVDGCPGLAGPESYAGCPVAVRTTTVLKVTDQRAMSPACGGTTSCSLPQAGAIIEVYDRSRLKGLTIARRDGGTVALTRNPESQYFDDIFESPAAYTQAGAAAFGCTADATGTCTAGVRSTGDLLALVRFADGSKTIYVGRSVAAADFVDTNGDGRADLTTQNLQVIKKIDGKGVVTYSGAKNTFVVT